MRLYLKSSGCPNPDIGPHDIPMFDFGIILTPVETRKQLDLLRQIEDRFPERGECYEFVITTSNIAAINWFGKEFDYEDVFAWDPDISVWVSLANRFERDWLAHFTLGDLYLNGEFDLQL